MEQTVSMNVSLRSAKGKAIAYWTVTAALVFVMLAGATGELTQQFGTVETHTVLGYPLFLLNIIGTWKILGVIAIVVPRFPRLKEWAYAGMFFNMTGAFLSHAIVGDSKFHLIYTGSVLLLVVASWALRPQSRTLGKLTDSFGSILKRA
ncbi:DoxX family protein [Ktedonobacter robiniae]|uniref:DoxX-like family protein n=1 Tax=Ktedonobacter robiniae TaxID=2778365 RepID=A0ABQ3V7Q9_9CHLR|nr:DoxX family protein [Ktedonobacter robiniae]GHO60967.1 hypothetical protein KSB_94420 [Ktedonobacter robiniae]